MATSREKRMRGTDLARAAGNVAHADAIDDMKEQLLIVLLKRLGGSADIPAAEIDDTGNDLFAFRADLETRVFHFEVQRKQ